MVSEKQVPDGASGWDCPVTYSSEDSHSLGVSKTSGTPDSKVKKLSNKDHRVSNSVTLTNPIESSFPGHPQLLPFPRRGLVGTAPTRST